MITFEDIKKANCEIKTTPVKGKDYAEVPQRIKAFRMCYPNGSITTDILEMVDGIVTMKATVCNEEGKVIGTGLAQEKESSSYINKTSYIENCETSAVGRALGMCGFGIDTSIASAEEVQNAILNQEEKEKKVEQKVEQKVVAAKASEEQIELIYDLYSEEEFEIIYDWAKVTDIRNLTASQANALIKRRKVG